MKFIVLATGVGSTALLNYFLKPYVLAVDLLADGSSAAGSASGAISSSADLQALMQSQTARQLQNYQVKITTLDLFNRLREQQVKIGDLRKPEHISRPMVNLIKQAPPSSNDANQKFFYVHEEMMKQMAGDKLWTAMQRDPSSL